MLRTFKPGWNTIPTTRGEHLTRDLEDLATKIRLNVYPATNVVRLFGVFPHRTSQINMCSMGSECDKRVSLGYAVNAFFWEIRLPR